MSYLNAVRLHFAGTFRANPSTVNNEVRHFNTPTFKERYQTLEDDENKNGWWNPRGANAFRFSECRVTRACYADGSAASSPRQDPVVSMILRDGDDRPSAKIVDLDPMQQYVTEIWGLQVNVTDGTRSAIRGEFLATAFSDMWWVRRAPFFQSILTPATIDNWVGSRCLEELQKHSDAGALSIKFVLDRYGSRGFTYGRVYGTIGPCRSDEPRHFVAGRYLRPTSADPVDATNLVYCVPAVLDGDLRKLRFDFANALLTTGDAALNIGPLAVGYLDEQNEFVPLSHTVDGKVKLDGVLNYAAPNWYERTAGIVDFPVNRELRDDEIAAVSSRPLAVAQVNASSKFNVVTSENRLGLLVRPDQFTFRINPGDDQNVTIFATKFGEPAAGLDILAVATIQNFGEGTIGDPDEAHLPLKPKSGIPEDAVSYPSMVTTDSRGVAMVKITTKDPGTPRFLDGQLYGAAFYPAAALLQDGDDQVLDPDYRHNPYHALSILLWSGIPPVSDPNWYRDIRPILELYANLYPIMKGMVRLDDYDSVVSNGKLIAMAMGLDETHPNYMPVTRDLSRAKKQMILQWLDSADETGSPPKGPPPKTGDEPDAPLAEVREGKATQFTKPTELRLTRDVKPAD